MSSTAEKKERSPSAELRENDSTKLGGNAAEEDFDSQNPFSDSLPLFKDIPLVRLGSEPHTDQSSYNESWKLAWPNDSDIKKESPAVIYWSAQGHRAKAFTETWQVKSITMGPLNELEDIRNQVGLLQILYGLKFGRVYSYFYPFGQKFVFIIQKFSTIW